MTPRTPAQTIGPFFGFALTDRRYVVPEGTPGVIWVRGVVLDGEARPVTDALVETWQVQPDGFGRCATDERGRYAIHTVKPGAVEGQAPPHLEVAVFARGLLDRVITRAYFADEAEANAADPVLQSLEAARGATLLAEPTRDGYRFDIQLQGERETVFFAC